MSRTPSEGRRFFSIATSRSLLALWQDIEPFWNWYTGKKAKVQDEKSECIRH